MTILDSGDIVWIMFDPQAGHEQAGLRPALVLSPKAYNGKVGPEGLQIKGAILSDQVKSLEWRA